MRRCVPKMHGQTRVIVRLINKLKINKFGKCQNNSYRRKGIIGIPIKILLLPALESLIRYILYWDSRG